MTAKIILVCVYIGLMVAMQVFSLVEVITTVWQAERLCKEVSANDLS